MVDYDGDPDLFDLDDLTEFAAVLEEEEEAALSDAFLNCAETLGLLTNVHTVIVPPSFVSPSQWTVSERNKMYVLWHRHASASKVELCDMRAVTHLKTLSALAYAIYFHEDAWWAGDVRLSHLNKSYTTQDGRVIVLHYADAQLIDFRLQVGDIMRIPLVVLAGQTFQVECVNFPRISCPTSFQYSFRRFSDRSCVGSRVIASETSPVRIDVPAVNVKEEVNLWMQFVHCELSIPIVSWLRHQNMIILPNTCDECSPEIGDFNPSRAVCGTTLWIQGHGFSPFALRVSIGDKNALVYAASSELIKCVVPDLGNDARDVRVQVSNRQTFTTARFALKYRGRPKK